MIIPRHAVILRPRSLGPKNPCSSCLVDRELPRSFVVPKSGTPQDDSARSSERILQRKLQDARTRVAKNLTESVVLQIIVRRAEIYMIPYIEEFEAELQLLLFVNGKVAAYVRIDIKVPGAE